MAGYNETTFEEMHGCSPAELKAKRAEAERLAFEKSEAGMKETARKVVDSMDTWDGLPPYRDEVAEIIAGLEGEEES